jgi:type I restriction enzyme R subunit
LTSSGSELARRRFHKSMHQRKSIGRSKMRRPSPATSERLTRKRIVDSKLRAAGWSVSAFKLDLTLGAYNNCAIEEYPTDSGPADYALCVGGQILGVVEAKKLTLGPQEVLPQAERYSRGVSTNHFDFNGFRVPFLYSTNGEMIWHHDVRHPLNRSHIVAAFHTPDALREFLARNVESTLDQLLARPNDHPRLRPYQREANAGIENAILNRKRQMLVAMATGTGKTFTMVNEVYRLMKSGVAKRILFLVDRRALAAQAVRAFASHDAEPNQKFDRIYEVYSQRFHREDFDEDEKFDPKVLPNAYLTSPKPGHAFVYVSTIQRMTVNLFGRNAIFNLGDEAIDDDAIQLDIPIHAFDLVIADECHRGYTASGGRYLAADPRSLRRHQNRFDGHSRRAHHGILQRSGVPLLNMKERFARASWLITILWPSIPTFACMACS